MIDLGGNFCIGIGNEPASYDGAAIANITADGKVTVEYQLSEQGCHDMHVYNGKIYVPGTDPTDDWTLGNIYIRDTSGEWVKRRTLPLTLHCWGACHDHNGDLWVACGCHAGDNVTWEGMVMRSTDDGLTWAENILLNGYRMFDVIEHNNIMCAAGWHWSSQTGYQAQLWCNTGDGWVLFDGVQPYRYPRLTPFGDMLITWHNVNQSLIDCVTGIEYPVPFAHIPSLCNPFAVVSDWLYCVDGNGYIWRSKNLTSWERYSYVQNAISIGYWPSQNCLVVSDKGTQAKLWRIQI